MKKMRGEQGGNALLVPVVFLAVFFIAAASFGVWAFGQRQDYKNNVDAKVSAAVALNKQQVQIDDAKTYAEQAKNPLKIYTGPDAYGSIHVSYPKTWSAYVDTTSGSQVLDAYFHADYVPSTQAKQPYNLRVQVVATAYSAVMQQYTSQVKAGKVTASPYALPKVASVSGSLLTGQILPGDVASSGTMVVLPLRDKTLKIWTESPSFASDFNTYILPNLTFVP
jgi:Flp pilus assembly protein TadG